MRGEIDKEWLAWRRGIGAYYWNRDIICMAESKGFCTLPVGHGGMGHVAHMSNGEVVDRWVRMDIQPEEMVEEGL